MSWRTKSDCTTSGHVSRDPPTPFHGDICTGKKSISNREEIDVQTKKYSNYGLAHCEKNKDNRLLNI